MNASHMKFISIDKELWIPADVAVCPVCRSTLSAVPDAYQQLFPAVNLYLPRSTQRISCVRNARHANWMLEEWFKAYDRVGLWLQLDPVAIELGPESQATP